MSRDFQKQQEMPAAQAHHTSETSQLANLAKVDLLQCSHALGKCGLFETVEMKMPTTGHYSYHITHDAEPTMPHWPNGSWAVYAITGDQIAERTVFKNVKQGNFGPHHEGGVIARHSWCGYLGMAETLDGVRELIEKHERQEEARKVRKSA